MLMTILAKHLKTLTLKRLKRTYTSNARNAKTQKGSGHKEGKPVLVFYKISGGGHLKKHPVIKHTLYKWSSTY